MTLSVKNLVTGIENGKYLLPTIQRGFVWDTRKIENLFDSLMVEFPIASFLFWNVTKGQKDTFKFYPFVKEYQDGEIDARQATTFANDCDPVAVLDGQQRMTALYIGLMGSYTPKKRANSPNEPKPKYLYLNLLHKNDDADDDSAENVNLNTYEFKFLNEDEAKERDDKTHGFKVSQILDKDFDKINYIFTFLKTEFAEEPNIDFTGVPYEILNTLWNCIRNDSNKSLNVIEAGDNKDIADIFKIFVRINNGGKPINPADMLMSFAEAQLGSCGFNVEKNVVELMKSVNNDGEFDISKEFILRAVLILLVEGESKKDIKFSIDSFKAGSIKKLPTEWNKISDAIKSAVALMRKYGFNQKSIPSYNALLSVVHYIYLNPAYAAEENKIMRWFITTSFSDIFAKSTDEALNNFRKILNKSHDTFPLNEMLEKAKCTGLNLIDLIMQTNYGDTKRAWMALTILYGKDYLEKADYEIDHIFPKAKISTIKNLMETHNIIDKEKFEPEYLQYQDALPNLELLTKLENRTKSSQDFKEWLAKQNSREEYIAKHFIPELEDYTFGNFKEFFDERAKTLREQLEVKLNGIL